MTLGENIRTYREDASMTQEQMASHLHISPQAISKWERDESMPDSALLPAIADVLGVSIDRLFDRKTVTTDDVVYAILYRIAALPPEERWKELRTIAFAGEQSLFIDPSVDLISPEKFFEKRFWKRHPSKRVSIETIHGFALSSNRPELTYSTAFIEPEGGWKPLFDPAELREVFEILAEEESLRTLFALYEKKPNELAFDDGYAKREFGLADPEATLEKLRKLRLLRTEMYNIDGMERRLWVFNARCELMAVFVILKELLSPSVGFNGSSTNRRVPYLREKR